MSEEVKRTPTETILAVMEEFGQSECKECIVIYTNKEGDICWSASTDSVVKKLGMLEAVKSIIVAKWTASEMKNG